MASTVHPDLEQTARASTLGKSVARIVAAAAAFGSTKKVDVMFSLRI
jgi:hypothetical protein